MIELLKEEILKQLSLINEEDLEECCTKIRDILYCYRDKGMSKDDAHSVILDIGKNVNFSERHEEVIIEIDCRMSGFTSPNYYISW